MSANGDQRAAASAPSLATTRLALGLIVQDTGTNTDQHSTTFGDTDLTYYPPGNGERISGVVGCHVNLIADTEVNILVEGSVADGVIGDVFRFACRQVHIFRVI